MLCAAEQEEERRSHLITRGDLSFKGKVRPYYRLYLFTILMQSWDSASTSKHFSIQHLSMALLLDFLLEQFSLHYPPAQLEEVRYLLYH